MPRKSGIGVVATKESNKAVQHVLDEDKSEQPPSKRQKYTTHLVTNNMQRWESMLPKMEMLQLLENSIWRYLTLEKHYLDELQVSSGVPVTVIMTRKRGGPLILSKINEEVQKFLRVLRKAVTPILLLPRDCHFKVSNFACWA